MIEKICRRIEEVEARYNLIPICLFILFKAQKIPLLVNLTIIVVVFIVSILMAFYKIKIKKNVLEALGNILTVFMAILLIIIYLQEYYYPSFAKRYSIYYVIIGGILVLITTIINYVNIFKSGDEKKVEDAKYILIITGIVGSISLIIIGIAIFMP